MFRSRVTKNKEDIEVKRVGARKAILKKQTIIKLVLKP